MRRHGVQAGQNMQRAISIARGTQRPVHSQAVCKDKYIVDNTSKVRILLTWDFGPLHRYVIRSFALITSEITC